MIQEIDAVLSGYCNHHLSTISEVSAGTDTNSESKLFYVGRAELFNLDKIVKEFIHPTTKSSDALKTYNNKIYLIEFKSGKEDNIKKDDLQLKLFDSINSLYKLARRFIPSTKRSDFLDLKFVYLVVYKSKKSQPVLARLQRSAVKWGLSEYSDFFIEEAITEFRTDKIIEMLREITKSNDIYYAIN